MRLSEILRRMLSHSKLLSVAAGRDLPGQKESSVSESIGFSGDYTDWDAALAGSTGYDSAVILRKTREAALKVKNGEAPFERDSVIFSKIEYAFPVLATLLRAGAENGGNLSVLDFGGALGSSYYQCRDFLTGLSSVRWSVIEQPAHVACGRAEFQDEKLRFYYTIDECLQHERPNVILLSCVLQYLKDPYLTLRDILGKEMKYVILDRMALIKSSFDRLTVESVPASIYSATYPAWFLSEPKLLSMLEGSYSLVSDFTGFDTAFYRLDGAEIQFKGYIFALKSATLVSNEPAPAARRPLMINVGCGMRTHPDWVNIDIQVTRPGVIAHDISASLPQETNSCDVVYHSAVLEHIRPRDALRFISECHRVLKPGGVIRVGVPDLEELAMLYLQKLHGALNGAPGAEPDYDWIMLEIFDQMVRERSGGEMLHYLAANPMPNEAFVFERIGVEGEEIIHMIRQNPQGVAAARNERPPNGPSVGAFRLSGEAHQWMYDRFSLNRLLRKAGFVDFRVVSARESRIPNWADYHLDVTLDSKVIKPDLFFSEAVKGA